MERMYNTGKIGKEHKLICSELAQHLRAGSVGKGICCQA